MGAGLNMPPRRYPPDEIFAGLLAGIPCSMPSTLMSSSISGQRIPEPLLIISNRERCSGVASESRHARGRGGPGEIFAINHVERHSGN